MGIWLKMLALKTKMETHLFARILTLAYYAGSGSYILYSQISLFLANPGVGIPCIMMDWVQVVITQRVTAIVPRPPCRVRLDLVGPTAAAAH